MIVVVVGVGGRDGGGGDGGRDDGGGWWCWCWLVVIVLAGGCWIVGVGGLVLGVKVGGAHGGCGGMLGAVDGIARPAAAGKTPTHVPPPRHL